MDRLAHMGRYMGLSMATLCKTLNRRVAAYTHTMIRHPNLLMWHISSIRLAYGRW